VNRNGDELVLSEKQCRDHQRLAPMTIANARRCIYDRDGFGFRRIADLWKKTPLACAAGLLALEPVAVAANVQPPGSLR
jgi:hypothetical protein